MRKQISLKSLCELMIICYNIWYIFPILRGVASDGIFQTLFFGINILGLLGIMLNSKGKIHINAVMFPVLLMLIVFFVMTICDIGDISRHIRVCVAFWITGITYMLLDNEQRVKIGKVMLVAIIITTVTSAIAVIGNNEIARTLTSSQADDALQLSYKLKNVSSIYLFQGFSVFVPVLLALAKTKKQKLVTAVIIIFLLVSVIGASFTISFILFMVSLAISIILMNAKNKNTIIVSILAVVILGVIAVNLDTFLSVLIRLINNPRITEKLETIRIAFSYENINFTEFGARFELYKMSLNTFVDNLLGVGPRYSFATVFDGIGYHSQILDDLGRYGIFALAFYASFFWGYYKLLKKEWSKIGETFVAKTVTLMYIMMLLLNIGFKSAEEGVIMLFIIPSLPEIVLSVRKKRENSVTASSRTN